MCSETNERYKFIFDEFQTVLNGPVENMTTLLREQKMASVGHQKMSSVVLCDERWYWRLLTFVFIPKIKVPNFRLSTRRNPQVLDSASC